MASEKMYILAGFKPFQFRLKEFLPLDGTKHRGGYKDILVAPA
jgi:hypothetical protein